MGAFNPDKLEALSTQMLGYVDRGQAAGIVTGLWRKGEWHIDAIGLQDLRTKEPMRPDSIFRIASMSKPIVAVAALMLVEEGILALDDAIDRWLPEVREMQVLRSLASPLTDTVPLARPITVRDLLTFTLGTGFVLAPPGTYPIQQAIADAGMQPGPRPPAAAPDEWIKTFASLPLVYQPGEKWLYHTGSNVLSVLIARAAAVSLDVFLEQRIFAPLGMKDTGFFVNPDNQEKMDRFTTSYRPLPDGSLEIYDDPRWGRWSAPPAFQSGGGGLVSTAADYMAFARMLLDGGRYAGGRLLKEESVSEMVRDQLTPEQKLDGGFGPGYWDTRGWGFGLAVFTGRNCGRSPGTFGWDGGLGTSAYCDPAENLVGILLTQTMWTSGIAPKTNEDFWNGTYAALAPR
jgi:CubicO group peptidase (beta-lactamase class C family)